MTLSIDRMFAFIAVSEDGEGEGIAAHYSPELGGWMPLVGADMDRMTSYKPIAQELANKSGRRIVLSQFESRIDLEVLEPIGVGNAGTFIIGGT